jgi:hypothetical protein
MPTAATASKLTFKVPIVLLSIYASNRKNAIRLGIVTHDTKDIAAKFQPARRQNKPVSGLPPRQKHRKLPELAISPHYPEPFPFGWKP